MYLYDSTQVIPVQATNPDTFHDADTWWQRAIQGDFELFGEAVKYFTGGFIKGTADALKVPETVIWVGVIGAVIYIATKK